MPTKRGYKRKVKPVATSTPGELYNKSKVETKVATTTKKVKRMSPRGRAAKRNMDNLKKTLKNIIN